MNKKNIVNKAIEYVNRFGYIQWDELKEISHNKKSSIWTVKFSAKQNETKEIFLYTLDIDDLSGNISNMQMTDD